MALRPEKKKRSSEAGGTTAIADWRSFLLRVMVIVGAGVWVFWPALHGDWLWDDDILITNNVIVHDPGGFWKIWFEPGKLVDYFPLTVSVEWMEWQLWREHTFGYHLISVILHISSALLVWHFLNKLGLRLAWLGGLIFIIHPVVVESVAWIAELKNTLSLPPFLLAMCAFIDYEERGKRRDYFLALGLFLVAMLCKTSMAPFPVVILLYLWWKRSRIGWGEIKVAVPFFAISLGLGLVTTWFLNHHANSLSEHTFVIGGFFSRLALASLSIAFYFSKCFWPVGLLPIYPKWTIDPPSLAQFLTWPILAGVICWFWMKRASWGRHALLGLGFFLLTLAPFVGLIAGSYMYFTWVMDHLLYIPLIGLIGLTVAGLGQVDRQLPASFRPFGIGIVAVVIGWLAWQSHVYAGVYLNQETFWNYTLQYNPDVWLAHNDLGIELSRSGRLDEAEKHFREALRLRPDYAEAHNNLGLTLIQNGNVSGAMEEYRQAVKIKPDYAAAHNNLANALTKANRIPEAIEEYEQTLKINPGYAKAHYNLGVILSQAGQIPQAIEHFELFLKINPNNTAVRNQLAQLRSLHPDVPPAGSSGK